MEWMMNLVLLATKKTLMEEDNIVKDHRKKLMKESKIL